MGPLSLIYTVSQTYLARGNYPLRLKTLNFLKNWVFVFNIIQNKSWLVLMWGSQEISQVLNIWVTLTFDPFLFSLECL